MVQSMVRLELGRLLKKGSNARAPIRPRADCLKTPRMLIRQTTRENGEEYHPWKWGIVQAQPTKGAARPFCFSTLSPLAPRGKSRRGKTGIPGACLCRLGLKNPPP